MHEGWRHTESLNDEPICFIILQSHDIPMASKKWKDKC